jgi:predicted secreted protein
MTVGAGVLGRNILLTVAGQPIAGVRTKGITIAGEPVDVTTDDSNGFRELLAQAGTQSCDIALSGVTKNLELLRSHITNESKVYALVITYPEGSTLTLDGFMANYNSSGEYNNAETFDATFQSSGAYTFVAG